jgi:hypothetical protein
MNVVGAIAAVILVAALSVLFVGWVVMLGIGILAGSGVVPATLAFGDAVWLGVIISILLTGTAGASKS